MTTRLLGTAALVALAVFAAAAAGAAPSSTIQAPAGAQVSVRGSTVSLMINGTSGTYKCSCSSQGQCAVSQQGPIITCASDAKTPCSGTCQMDTKTNPKGIGAAASAGRSSVGAARAP
jgi:hypothetical protein